MDAIDARERLWIPLIAPVIWALHFMVCYAWVALACGRLASEDTYSAARTGVAVSTMVACAAITFFLYYGFQRHGRRLPDRPNDDGTPEDRTRFMAFTTMLLAALSLIATLFVGVAALAAGPCL